ncbi:universal stress protein [Paraburkholderia tagetis]|uniref:Universal stress protein n=1 Tax=Paraburkholderia tagetis TaxID=2913261 RepID=A0A9X2A1Y8_9BURK|nr:universal stress protein [Paraburkholderia tagetis]MCG5078935.1 universal stress protein [Paraburkholderia tagetis]
MYRHFLVPVDDSDAGIDTVAHAVALARSVGARITFAHFARASQDGERAAAGRLFDDCVREMVAMKAEAAARALGVPCESMGVAGSAAQHALADAARAWGCDLVCVAPQALVARDGVDEGGGEGEGGGVAGFFAGMDAEQFAALDVPVLNCVVRRGPAAARVVAALYRAHRATAVALCERLAHFGLAHLGLAQSGQALPGLGHDGLPDPGIDALRIPRFGSSDVCGFSSLLRERTSVVDAELGELEHQHRRGTALFAELMHAVDEAAKSTGSTGVAPPARVEEVLNGYAQFVWEYFGRKEGVIVPAAQRYLREDDWRELEAAFAASATGRAVGP